MFANTQGEFKNTFELTVPTPCVMIIITEEGDPKVGNRHRLVHRIECPSGGKFELKKLEEGNNEERDTGLVALAESPPR